MFSPVLSSPHAWLLLWSSAPPAPCWRETFPTSSHEQEDKENERFWEALCFPLTDWNISQLFPSVPAKLRKYRLVLLHQAFSVGLLAAWVLHCVHVSDRIWFPGVLTQINSMPPQPQVGMGRLLSHLEWLSFLLGFWGDVLSAGCWAGALAHLTHCQYLAEADTRSGQDCALSLPGRERTVPHPAG